MVVTPNRRGVKSRALVLDAAERVMAAEGFEAATIARVVEESGVPLSSVYHYFGSKDGVLLAVMERGAERFFADLPEPDRRAGRPADHLRMIVTTAVQALERHPDFLRLLVAFAVQPADAGTREVDVVVGRVRQVALRRLRTQIALAFQDEPDSPTIDRLARFALAAFDGAFVASQCDRSSTVHSVLEPLAASLVAARRVLAGQGA
jgi:AcrR family transcriptional regulator